MIELLLTYKYFIILPLAVIEGPFVMMICGFLVKLGYLNFILTFILLVIGDLCSDVVWYKIGDRFGVSFVRKFGKFFNITEETLEKMKNAFLGYHSTIIFLSKITMGLGLSLLTLITAGSIKMSFKKFVIWNTLGGLMWTGGLMMIGFFLGDFYLKVNGVLGKIGILSVFVIVFILLIGVVKYLRRKVVPKNLL